MVFLCLIPVFHLLQCKNKQQKFIISQSSSRFQITFLISWKMYLFNRKIIFRQMVFQTDFLRKIIIRQIQMFQHLTDHFRQCTVCHACRQAVNRLHTVQFFFIRRRSIYFRMFHLTAAIFYGDFSTKHHNHAPSQRTSEKRHVKPGDFTLTSLVCDRGGNHGKIPHFFYVNIACNSSHHSHFLLILSFRYGYRFPENVIITGIIMQKITHTVNPQPVEQCFCFLAHSFQ